MINHAVVTEIVIGGLAEARIAINKIQLRSLLGKGTAGAYFTSDDCKNNIWERRWWWFGVRRPIKGF